ncbi:MAG: ANTAR domain-containing protein [Lachnospiraceae bacterium]|jgi:response regulator NasT|nr:ANTAR domain-containing protein [Lachnospiraceae bacterium]
MKGRSKSCYVLAAAGKEESILLLRQILRGVSGAGQLRVQQAVTLDEIRRGVSGAGAQAPADLLIAVMPLSDGTGIEGIIHVAQRHPQLMTILLVRQEAYEQVTYQCRNQQIFVIAMPFKRQILAEAASFMLRIRTVMDDKDKELVRLKKNLSEIRIITSAKIRLMQTRQMTEEEAHYYLEKEAMDRSLSKKEVAEEILR